MLMKLNEELNSKVGMLIFAYLIFMKMINDTSNFNFPLKKVTI
jgi:hypothetical protein